MTTMPYESLSSLTVGNLVHLRGREWIVLETPDEESVVVRPLAAGADRARRIYLPREAEPPHEVRFAPPDPTKAGPQYSAALMKDACRLRLRSGAGPFRSFGAIRVEPRAYQLVPLMMALTHRVVRLLIADDVGVGKTVEAGLIAKELLERGEIERFTILCPPSLCEQWKTELRTKFLINAQVVTSASVSRIERGMPSGQSLFEYYPYTIVSLDYIKSRRYRDEFIRTCPDFVIVEEAHSCVLGSAKGQHLRFELLKRLAEDQDRHMVLLTATPHSGNEEAFYNLLALLDPEFIELKQLGRGAARDTLRDRLARHFVQRRRADIEEWRDSTCFPDRLSGDLAYEMTGPMLNFIGELSDLTQSLLQVSDSNDMQSVHWWSALALLRAGGSSPAAVEEALNKKLNLPTGLTETEREELVESMSQDYLLDGGWATSDCVSDDICQGAAPAQSDLLAPHYNRLLATAGKLKGPKTDTKLKLILDQVQEWVNAGIRPIIFCRYIPTARYVSEHLSKHLVGPTNVRLVTGEMDNRSRVAVVEEMAEQMDAYTPVLVATDCLSEGINLQHVFDAVVHYDLPWNPSRLEQREGRVDRFGQPSRAVHAVLITGNNNPVDSAVLKVILRKAESIRKELGVQIPVLEDSSVVCKALLEQILKERKKTSSHTQLEFDFSGSGSQLEVAWESAKENAKASRTKFAQRGLRPDQVLPEWQRMQDILGDSSDVLRFLSLASQRLGAPLEKISTGYRLPIQQLPKPIREELDLAGYNQDIRFTDRSSTVGTTEVIHRSHPLVLALADHLAECAMVSDDPNLAARTTAFHTDAVAVRHYIFLLRMRFLLESSFTDGRRRRTHKSQLVEELVALQLQSDQLQVLSDAELNHYLQLTVNKNMLPERRSTILEKGLSRARDFEGEFMKIAKGRAKGLHRDHIRVRSASQIESRKTAWTCSVNVTGHPDLLGLYVLEPIPKFD